MELAVHGKQMDVGDSLRGHVKEKLEDLNVKYFNHTTYATVTFSREGHGHQQTNVHITIKLGKNIMVIADAQEADPRIAFDAAADRGLTGHIRTEPFFLRVAVGPPVSRLQRSRMLVPGWPAVDVAVEPPLGGVIFWVPLHVQSDFFILGGAPFGGLKVAEGHDCAASAVGCVSHVACLVLIDPPRDGALFPKRSEPSGIGQFSD